METSVEVVAVGDILMWQNQITSAADGGGGYKFDSMFASVAPVLKAADLTIGNLETTFSGRERVYQRRSRRTGFPRFNCPDELAATLKRVGFNVLTTANNHCMDRGESGLKRTLETLNRHGLQHTGTFSSQSGSRDLLICRVKGVNIGIAAYTYGTNLIPVPKARPWLVNRINVRKITADLRRLRTRSDFVIVALHFGQEFQRRPNKRQKRLVDTLLKNGADVILGAHPHVLQPVVLQTVRDVTGVRKRRVAAYSLGNFISDRMMGNPHADIGMMLRLTIHKDTEGQVRLDRVSYLPTWVQRWNKGQKYGFRVLPTSRYRNLSTDSRLRQKLQRIHDRTLRHVRRQR